MDKTRTSVKKRGCAPTWISESIVWVYECFPPGRWDTVGVPEACHECSRQNLGLHPGFRDICINGECKCIRREQGKDSTITPAHDPNIKYGPGDNVSPGQRLTYRVEYENEGQGIAFGVYFTDTLDEDLDDSTLEVGPVMSTTDDSVIGPAGIYNPSTRTITWLVGEVGPGEGGYADFSVNVRSDAEAGTDVINFATVYFPSVPEETRTNGIVSVIPDTLEAISVDMDVSAGWSMFSLPVDPSDKRLKALFPEAVVVYGYEKERGYVRVKPDEELEVRKGYWILLDQATSYTITGHPIHSYTHPVYEDEWAIIGGCTDPAQVLPHGCDIGVIYTYVQGVGYQRVPESEPLETCKGYWIFLNNVADGATISVETID